MTIVINGCDNNGKVTTGKYKSRLFYYKTKTGNIDSISMYDAPQLRMISETRCYGGQATNCPLGAPWPTDASQRCPGCGGCRETGMSCQDVDDAFVPGGLGGFFGGEGSYGCIPTAGGSSGGITIDPNPGWEDRGNSEFERELLRCVGVGLISSSIHGEGSARSKCDYHACIGGINADPNDPDQVKMVADSKSIAMGCGYFGIGSPTPPEPELPEIPDDSLKRAFKWIFNMD